jgi:hypothetical protein
MIYLEPNIYLPGPRRLTGKLIPAALRDFAKSSSIGSPLTGLYGAALFFEFKSYLSFAYF